MNARCSNAAKQKDQRAFTVKELLVVLFVLGLLGTVAFAAMSGARDRTVVAQCESNLRQFSLAMLVYGSENNDKLPSQPPGIWAWDLPWAAGNALNSYGAPWQVMYCPGTAGRFSSSEDYALYYSFAAGLFHVVDYALTLGGGNVGVTNINSSISPQSVMSGIITFPPPLPSQRVLLADATLNNLPNGSGSWDIIQGGYNKAHTSAHMAGTIPAGGNVAFLDSHVEWRPFSQMIARTTPGIAPSFWW